VLAIDPGTSTYMHRIQSVSTGWVATVYGTGYRLRYVCHNNVSGIVMEYITGTPNFFKFVGVTAGRCVVQATRVWGRHAELGRV
jgi:hypothetical protein